MDPESLKNVPAYLVLAYAIEWDSVKNAGPEYVLLDFRAYQPSAKLGEEGLMFVASNLLNDRFGRVLSLKVKVIEEGVAQ